MHIKRFLTHAHVLQLDIQRTPQAWISLEQAALHHICEPMTHEEADMPLVYLPCVPNRFEDFLLEGRLICGDVHSWLAVRLPKASRLH